MASYNGLLQWPMSRERTMSNQPVTLTYEVDLLSGEPLALPANLTANLGAGRWLIPVGDRPLSNCPQRFTQIAIAIL
jgi:hypothetical protein